jgi:hypothetical protein
MPPFRMLAQQLCHHVDELTGGHNHTIWQTHTPTPKFSPLVLEKDQDLRNGINVTDAERLERRRVSLSHRSQLTAHGHCRKSGRTIAGRTCGKGSRNQR